MEDRTDAVGRVYHKKTNSETTLTEYNRTSQRKIKIPEEHALIPSEAYFDSTKENVVNFEHFIEYLLVDEVERCNIIRSLYGESFSRYLSHKLRLKSEGRYDGLTWIKFIDFMERSYISFFEPPVCHQEYIIRHIEDKQDPTFTLREYFNLDFSNQVSGSAQWKAYTVICESQMKETGETFSKLFQDKNENNSKEKVPMLTPATIFMSIESAATNTKSPYHKLSSLLRVMRIEVSTMKTVFAKAFDDDSLQKNAITIETLIMCIKLIDYGNAIFYNVKDLTVGNGLGEERLLEWLEIVSTMDKVSGDYEGAELLQYRRFISVQEALDDPDWKKAVGIQFDDRGREFVFSHKDWNEKVLPQCIKQFYDNWESVIM